MLRYLVLYAITVGIFFAIDILWIGVIAKNLYREKLGFILSDKVNWAAAIIFYLIYIGGIIYFAVEPAIQAQSFSTAIINGVLLGMLCYATYDLTNMATIAKWPLSITIIDIIWGGFLTGACSTATYFISTKINL